MGMRRMFLFFLLQYTLHFVFGQGEILDLSDDGILTIAAQEESSEEEDEPKIEKQILVIANHYPDYLNFFCQIRTRLQRDRFCYGGLDAYAVACADENPPLQLVPFCLGFKHHCGKLSFPTDSWCEREFDQYDKHCKRAPRNQCHYPGYDIECACEPYGCLEAKVGTRTAEWCQKYELFCNATSREDKRNEVAALLPDAVRVHKQCVELFGFAHAICTPFLRNFQWERCQKFLFDCELISDFPDDEEGGASLTEQLTEAQLHKQIEDAHAGIIDAKTINKEREMEKQKLEKEKTASEKAKEEREKQDRIAAAIEAEKSEHKHVDLTGKNEPEFLIGRGHNVGGKLVIEKIRVEPGKVIDKVVASSTTPRPATRLPLRVDVGFQPEEIFKLANEVAKGNTPKAKRGTVKWIEFTPRDLGTEKQWSSRFDIH